MILQTAYKGRARLLGAVVLALLWSQPLVAQEGWKLTLSGKADAMVATGQLSSDTKGRSSATAVLNSTDAAAKAEVGFEAAHDFGGVKLGLGSFLNKETSYIILFEDMNYAWLSLLAPLGVAKDVVDLNLAVGFLAGRANSASAVVDSDMLGDVRGASVTVNSYQGVDDVGKSWIALGTDPSTGKALATTGTIKLNKGAVARLEVKLLKVAVLRTLLFLGDWNQHNSADLSTAVVVEGLELMPGHKLGFSAGLTADLRDTKNSNYALKYKAAVPGGLNQAPADEKDGATATKTVSTLTGAVKYDADLGAGLALKVSGGIGLNNLFSWENDNKETAGPYADKKLKSNQLFVGWYAGASFGHKLLTLGVEAAGVSERKAAYQKDGKDQLAKALPVKNIVLELTSGFVRELSADAAKVDLFARTVFDFTDSNYLLRVVEFGAKYNVLESADGNLWLKLGYGLVLADNDNKKNYDYNTDLMKEGEPGLYLKVGGDFKKAL